MKSAIGLWGAIALFGFPFAAAAQEAVWLSDQQARTLAEALVRPTYPQPCYSTYRQEDLEGFATKLRRAVTPVGNRGESSVYFYNVASDRCEYVAEENGKPVRMIQVTTDCCDYGFVAVNRVARKGYWFQGEKRAETFKAFVRDEQIHPDLSAASSFIAMYRKLVWGESSRNELTSFEQLQTIAQQNFRSAYSPYERDSGWEKQFRRWWERFRARTPQLKLETQYEPTLEGTRVRGYAFNGFELTVPRTDPPPKGTPTLLQWTLLVKPDGTIEELPSKVVYAAR